MNSTGFAVRDGNGINMKSVYDTRRGAIVNWLRVATGWMALRETSDEEIEARWQAYHGLFGAEVVPITVTEAEA